MFLSATDQATRTSSGSPGCRNETTARVTPIEQMPASPRAADGECLALLGPGDAARTALLGRCASEHPEGALLVTSADPLFVQMDVAANVAFPLRARSLGTWERGRTASELISVAGLDGAARRAVASLDPPLRCRVLLARAFATARPLVLDQPFAILSSDERRTMHVLLRQLIRQRHTAVVLATSDRSELLACGDRIGIIEGGRVGRIGAVPAMLASPGSAFAARALLDAQLLAGRVADEVDSTDDAEIHLACGARMTARLSDQVGPGDLCLVAIRPDQVAFAAADAADLGGQALSATMVDVRNLGDHLRLRMRLEDGSQIWIRRPAASLTPRDIERASEPRGASLAWRPAQAMAYPHPQA